MRHRKKVKKLGRPVGHRKALLRNLASQIIQHHEIKTTLAKAKAARSFVERLITYAKHDTVHHRRLAFKHLQNRTLVKKLFDEIGPAFEDRNGGYTRVIKLGQRRGDGAEMAILQLVGFETSIVEAAPKGKKKKAAPKKVEAEKAVSEKAEEKEAAAETEEATKAKKSSKGKKTTKKAAEGEAKAAAEEAATTEAQAAETPAEETKETAAEDQPATSEDQSEEASEKKDSSKDDAK